MISPIDAPVVGGTEIYGLNDYGWIVGVAGDTAGGGHGVLFFPSLSKTASYDYPGALVTGFLGFNNKLQICGFYIDGVGTHGLVVGARLATEN